MTLARRTPMKRTGRIKPKPVASLAVSNADTDHMDKVAALPCIICAEYGMQQLSATQVHHVFHDRFSTRRAPDNMTIPLCEGHHTGLLDTSKLAIHRAKAEWLNNYGADHEWIARTLDMIEEMAIT